jgi:hypothetical protein
MEAVKHGKFGIKRFFSDYIEKLIEKGMKGSTLQSIHSII